MPEETDRLYRAAALSDMLKGTPDDENLSRSKDLTEGARLAVELSGRREYFRLRKIWSGWMIGWISALILFNILITILVGSGTLDYSQYEWFITAVTVQTFLQIVGLGAIAVKYLFAD